MYFLFKKIVLAQSLDLESHRVSVNVAVIEIFSQKNKLYMYVLIWVEGNYNSNSTMNIYEANLHYLQFY